MLEYNLFPLFSQVQLTCSFCGFTHTVKKVFVQHVHRHIRDYKTEMKCPLCTNMYSTVKSWLKHFAVHELQDDDKSDSESHTSRISRESQGAARAGNSASCFAHGAEETDVHPQTSTEGKCAERTSGATAKIGEFLVALRAEHALPEATVKFIIDGMADIVQFTADECVALCATKVSELPGYQPTYLKALNEFKPRGRIAKYCKKNMPYVDPQAIVIGGEATSAQYVSVIQQLQALIEMGHLGLSSEQRNSADHSIRIKLYTDAFGTTNPLRGKSKKHKLLGVYFSVENGQPSLRSEEVYLAMLCNESLIKEHGLGALLEPLVRDLKLLSTFGLRHTDLSADERLRVVIRCVCGDNLGVHQLADFQESFSKGKHPCRYCRAVNEEFHTKLSVAQLSLRTTEEYEAQIRALEECDFDGELCKSFGIKGKCPLSQIKGFDVVNAFPPDIAHDLLEGVMPDMLCRLLTYLIVQIKLITVGSLNCVLRSFGYSRPDRRNKPSPVSRVGKEISLKLTASECWTLSRLLPLMIGSLVSTDCSEWKVFLDLLTILELVCATETDDALLEALRSKVETWLRSVKHVFPEIKLKPKHHYLLHYAAEMRKHGPLRYVWTLPFEAKHQVFKEWSRKMRNKKNLCRMLSVRHQEKQALRLSQRGRASKAPSLPEKLKDVEAKYGVSLQNMPEVICFRKVHINGICYQSGDVIVVRNRDPSNQSASELIKAKCFICADGVVAYIIAAALKISAFDRHYNSYSVTDDGCSMIVPPEIADFQPLGAYRVGRRTLVPLRHAVLGLNPNKYAE